jgi:integrase
VFAELINRNPVEGIRNVALNRKVRDPFTLEDLALLFPEDTGKLLEIWKDAEHAALYMVLAACGLRSGEARALQWRHLVGPVMISMGEGKVVPRYFLLVEQAVKFATGRTIGGTKAGKPRPVYLPERARGCLEWWRPQCPWRESTDLMFPSVEPGIPMGDQALRDRLKAAMKRAGIEVGQRTLTVHGFRHGYVTRSKRTLPTDLLLLMAGHSDEKVQSGYVHPRLEDQLEQIGQAAETIESTWPKRETRLI